MSTSTVIDLYKLYKTYFLSTPYTIDKNTGKATPITDYAFPANERPAKSIDYSNKTGLPFNKKSVWGKDIWFPVTIWESESLNIEIEACTVGVRKSKTIIRTAVSERKGTVKERFGVDDTQFTIKGFLIGKNNFFPEDQILKLQELHDSEKPIFLKGGYPQLFLQENDQVAILTLEFPEVEGKMPWIRPFQMTMESDSIQTLIVK